MSESKVVTHCPRCGTFCPNALLERGALSRRARGVTICSSCGTAEAMLDMMGEPPLPFKEWYASPEEVE